MPFLPAIGVALGVGTAATATAAATGVLASTIVGALAVGGAVMGIASGITGMVQSGKLSKQVIGIGELAAPASLSPIAEPAKAIPEVAQASAAEQVATKKKKTLLTGGLTKLTGAGGAPILQSMLQKKTLLGE